jgi:hypothetical protein
MVDHLGLTDDALADLAHQDPAGLAQLAGGLQVPLAVQGGSVGRGGIILAGPQAGAVGDHLGHRRFVFFADRALGPKEGRLVVLRHRLHRMPRVVTRGKGSRLFSPDA